MRRIIALALLILLGCTGYAQLRVQVPRGSWAEYQSGVSAKQFEMVLDLGEARRNYAIGIEPSDAEPLVAGGTVAISTLRISSVNLHPGFIYRSLLMSQFEMSEARVRVNAADLRGSVGIYLRVRRDSVVRVVVNGKQVATSQPGKMLMIKDGQVIDKRVHGSGSVRAEITPPFR